MILSNHLPDAFTCTDYAVVEGKRKVALRIVHGRRGYHVLLAADAVKLYTHAFATEDAAKMHALSCQMDLLRVAQARTAGLEELVESVLSRT